MVYEHQVPQCALCVRAASEHSAGNVLTTVVESCVPRDRECPMFESPEANAGVKHENRADVRVLWEGQTDGQTGRRADGRHRDRHTFEGTGGSRGGVAAGPLQAALRTHFREQRSPGGRALESQSQVYVSVAQRELIGGARHSRGEERRAAQSRVEQWRAAEQWVRYQWRHAAARRLVPRVDRASPIRCAAYHCNLCAEKRREENRALHHSTRLDSTHLFVLYCTEYPVLSYPILSSSTEQSRADVLCASAAQISLLYSTVLYIIAINTRALRMPIRQLWELFPH